MKHLKAYENNSFEWNKKKMSSLFYNMFELNMLAAEFIRWVENRKHDDIKVLDINIDHSKKIVIKWRHGFGKYEQRMTHVVNDEEQFFDFINDPELFKEKQKYNL